MTTKEKLSPKIYLLLIVLGLVFCSYVVSYAIIDLFYLAFILVFIAKYMAVKRI